MHTCVCVNICLYMCVCFLFLLWIVLFSWVDIQLFGLALKNLNSIKKFLFFFIFGVNNKNSELFSFNWKLCENR